MPIVPNGNLFRPTLPPTPPQPVTIPILTHQPVEVPTGGMSASPPSVPPTTGPIYPMVFGPINARPLIADLKRSGFIIEEGGHVRNLPSADDGIAFVRCVAQHLPPTWDLLDAFAHLDFGPWRKEGQKDINATLRSFGQFDTHPRSRGPKSFTLMHPFTNRLTTLKAILDLKKEGDKTLDETLRDYPELNLPMIVTRLKVELVVADIYLDHSEWLARLWPDDETLEKNKAALAESRDQAQGEIKRYKALTQTD